MEEKKEERWPRRRNAGALFIPAGIFLGLGLGFIVDNLVGGIMVGFGLGFFAYAAYQER